jgi:hypothetical protein
MEKYPSGNGAQISIIYISKFLLFTKHWCRMNETEPMNPEGSQHSRYPERKDRFVCVNGIMVRCTCIEGHIIFSLQNPAD